jgi:hypothetical protein
MDAPLPPQGNVELVIPTNGWGHKKIKLKNKFGQLNDADLNFVPGKEHELSERLQQRLNMGANELHALINAL